ncbi:MAG: BNR/Asp-box repeat protein [Bacteroidota bacterium]|jgi:hypothetical protein|nr:BNR/Asp-box repeat protein [Bacteroidota bacterium]
MKKVAFRSLLIFQIASLFSISSGYAQDGSKVESFALKGDLAFAGTCKGVYISADTGKTWKTVNSGLPEKACFKQMASTTNAVLTLTDFNKAYVTGNNGQEWKQIIEGTWIRTISSFKDRFYIASGKGLFVSSDDGKTWALSPEIPAEDILTVVSNSKYIIAEISHGAYDHLYYISSDGISWKLVAPLKAVSANAVEQQGDYFLLRTCQTRMGDYCKYYQMWLLSENGKKWEMVPFRARYFGFEGKDIYAITAHVPEIGKNAYTFEVEVLVSDDGGDSWTETHQEKDPDNAHYVIRNELKAVLARKDTEINQAKISAEGAAVMQAEYKANRARIKQSRKSNSGLFLQSNIGVGGSSPDYKSLSDDRFKQMHNKRDSYIDSKGTIHTR